MLYMTQMLSMAEQEKKMSLTENRKVIRFVRQWTSRVLHKPLLSEHSTNSNAVQHILTENTLELNEAEINQALLFRALQIAEADFVQRKPKQDAQCSKESTKFQILFDERNRPGACGWNRCRIRRGRLLARGVHVCSCTRPGASAATSYTIVETSVSLRIGRHTNKQWQGGLSQRLPINHRNQN
eukprot:gb/GEZN01014215.1/.p1 GENE.gb/GEZN01014215.1/~~gb/GEZN01014215.1/.p1  ORF type:complete len:184 (+),score=8.93 gb/GEZN01014215.1/:243-794(+)